VLGRHRVTTGGSGAQGSAARARAETGTQDFTLVNHTGVAVFSLYISESTNDDWEEDVLGEDVLPDGDRVNVKFSGKDAAAESSSRPDQASIRWIGRWRPRRSKSTSVVRIGTSSLTATAQIRKSVLDAWTPLPRQVLKSAAACS